MLTEPLTAPTTRWPRLAFAALVGFLFAPNVHIGSFYFTPEMALVIGNVFAWAVGPKGRFVLTLERIEQAAADTYDFVFSTPQPAGLPGGPVPGMDARPRPCRQPRQPPLLHRRLGADRGRGAPRRQVLPQAERLQAGARRHGARRHDPCRPDRRQLHPAVRSATRKLAFLAGGIGITPFRSMLQYLIDKGEARPITVLYGCESAGGHRLWRRARRGRTRSSASAPIYAVARGARRGQYPGYIDARLVKAAIPD